MAWLGPEHVARYGADPGLLTKLLDAGQRLPVHFHPGRAFAREALGLAHGKTEAWIVLEAGPDACVHVGFKHAVELATVREWMRTQDSAGDARRDATSCRSPRAARSSSRRGRRTRSARAS